MPDPHELAEPQRADARVKRHRPLSRRQTWCFRLLALQV